MSKILRNSVRLLLMHGTHLISDSIFRLTLNEFACFDGSVPARNAGYGISRLLRAL